MVSGGGCVPSRHMLNSVDFALVQAQKEPKITKQNVVSPTKRRWEKDALLFKSKNKRNKAPDEADWGVAQKPARPTSRGRGGDGDTTPKARSRSNSPSNTVLFGARSRSQTMFLDTPKINDHSDKNSTGGISKTPPSEKLRRFEQGSSSHATKPTSNTTAAAAGRRRTPTRSQVLESRSPLHRYRSSRNRGRDSEYLQGSPRGNTNTKTSRKSHRRNTQPHSPTPDRDQSRNDDEESRRRRFEEATTLREKAYSKNSNTEMEQTAIFDELSTVDFERQTEDRDAGAGPQEPQRLQGEDVEASWGEPQYSSRRAKGMSRLDPVEHFRDQLQVVDYKHQGGAAPHNPELRPQPKMKTVTNWGISEMVSDLSCSSSGLRQENMRDGARKTFSFATEKLQQALMDAKKQIYPGENLASPHEQENNGDEDLEPIDEESPRPTMSSPIIPAAHNRNESRRQSAPRPRQSTPEKARSKKETQQSTSRNPKKMHATRPQHPQERAIPSRLKSRSRSPDPMRSYHNSRSRAQHNIERLDQQRRERSRTPEPTVETAPKLAKTRSSAATSRRMSHGDVDLFRSRSTSQLSFRDNLLKSKPMSKPKSTVSSLSNDATPTQQRSRSVTPSRNRPADRSPSPTAMKIVLSKKSDSSNRSRSITPSRLFGFGRRKETQQSHPDEASEALDTVEERLQLIQQKRQIEERLAAMQPVSVGENSDISSLREEDEVVEATTNQRMARAASPSQSITRVKTPKKASAVQRFFGGKAKKESDMNGGDSSQQRSKSPFQPLSKRWFGGKREEVPQHTSFEVHNGSSYGRASSRKSSRDQRLLQGGSSSIHVDHSRGGRGGTTVASRNSLSTTTSASTTSGLVRHTTTFDSLMKAIEQDKQRQQQEVPPPEFAIVELGDETNAITAHSVLMNRTDVQRNLTGTEYEVPHPVETRPTSSKSASLSRRTATAATTSSKGRRKSRHAEPSFGASTTSTKASSKSRGKLASRESRRSSHQPQDDSKVEELEVTPSFTNELKTFQSLTKPPHRIPRGAYMI